MRSDFVEELENRVMLTGVSFSPPSYLAAGGSTIRSMVVADVTGDGKPDLITASPYTSSISVFPGNGDGTFGRETTYAVGPEPVALAVADFGGDGIEDIVVAPSGTQYVDVLYGTGNGTFKPAVTMAVSGIPESLAVDDLTGDGREDLVVICAPTGDAPQGAEINVFLNTAANGLQAQPVMPAQIGVNATTLAVGDLNGDGIPDLVLLYGSNNSALYLFLGTGNGAFNFQQSLANPGQGYSVVIGDFDGPGKADIAVANPFYGTVSIYLGFGNGSFQQPMETVATGGAIGGGHLAGPLDLNGDGNPDLLWFTGSSVYNVTCTPLLGNGNGSFAAAPPVALTTGNPTTGQIADLNGDGLPDLLVGYSNGVIASRVNKSSGGNVSFAPPVLFTGGDSYPRQMVAGDFNGDGILDLATADENANAVSILLGNGNGTFQAPRTFAAGPYPSYLAVADLNGDGKADLAVSNSSDESITILLGNGNGTFGLAAMFPLGGNPQNIVAKDVNGDGLVDLLVTEYQGNSVAVLLGNGNGTFSLAPTVPVGAEPQFLVLKDVNGDGIPDIITANPEDADISVALGNGNGTFAPQQTFAVGNGPNSLSVTDFNGDGKPDIAVSNEKDGTLGLLLGNGNGTFGPMQILASNGTSHGYLPQSADFSGDGNKDIIWASGPSNSNLTVQVFLGNGNGTFAPPTVVTTLGTYPSSAVVADVNGDGKPDVLIVYKYSGQIGVNLNASGGGVTTSGDTVMATGSTGDDDVAVSESGNNISVDFDGVTQTFSSDMGIVIDPGAGDDSVNLGADLPSVTVGGGGGNDTISSGGNDDLLRGGHGSDVLVAGGADTASGTSDTAIGGAGNDTVATSGTSEQLFGGPGDDLFVDNGGAGDLIDGGAGLNFAQANSGDTLTDIFQTFAVNPFAATPDIESDTVPDSAGGDDLHIYGTSGDDSIIMSDNGQGSLVVTENGGTPQLFPEAGLASVLLAGGEGNDTIAVDPSVTLPVSLRGAAGDDSLVGGGGDNVIVGGAGNDTLVGGEGTNDLCAGKRDTFEDVPFGNDVLIGGPAGSNNFADFAYREDNLYLSNDGLPDSGDTAAGEAITIMPSVQNIFAGSGNNTIVSTTAGSFLAAGVGHDSLVSGGVNTSLIAGPPGAQSDSVEGNGAGNAFFLLNGHSDSYTDTVTGDILQIDPGVDSLIG